MEENYQTLLRMKENQFIKAFEKNQMSCMIVKDENELKQYLRTVLKDQKKVAVGGSVTLSQLGIIDLIRESDVQFIDRNGIISRTSERTFERRAIGRYIYYRN